MHHFSDCWLAGLCRGIRRDGFVFGLDLLAGGGSTDCRLVFGLSRLASLFLLGLALVSKLAVGSDFFFLAWTLDLDRRRGSGWCR